MTKYKNYFRNHYKYKLSSDDIFRLKDWFYSQWVFINSKVKFKNGNNILEIGSGLGIFYSFVSEIGCGDNYVGLEMDKEAVRFSNSFFNTSKFKNIPIEDLESRKKYDQIVAFEVLEHLENPYQALKKINRLLEKRGYFIGTTPYPFPKNIYADKTHRYVLHPQNWEKLFTEVGFSQVKLYPMSFFPFLWRLNRYFNIKLPFYISAKYFISTCLIIAKK